MASDNKSIDVSTSASPFHHAMKHEIWQRYANIEPLAIMFDELSRDDKILGLDSTTAILAAGAGVDPEKIQALIQKRAFNEVSDELNRLTNKIGHVSTKIPELNWKNDLEVFLGGLFMCVGEKSEKKTPIRASTLPPRGSSTLPKSPPRSLPKSPPRALPLPKSLPRSLPKSLPRALPKSPPRALPRPSSPRPSPRLVTGLPSMSPVQQISPPRPPVSNLDLKNPRDDPRNYVYFTGVARSLADVKEVLANYGKLVDIKVQPTYTEVIFEDYRDASDVVRDFVDRFRSMKASFERPLS
jgi:hypothetical protein